MKKPLLLPALCAALLSLPFAPARAEEPQPPTPGYEAYALARVTVTAEAEKVDETAVTVAVTAEQIEARNAKNVAEALAFVPGLRVSTGRKNEPTVYVHGFDQTRVQVLIDGVPPTAVFGTEGSGTARCRTPSPFRSTTPRTARPS